MRECGLQKLLNWASVPAEGSIPPDGDEANPFELDVRAPYCFLQYVLKFYLGAGSNLLEVDIPA